MEKCYEYLACAKHDCIMRQRHDNTPCWQVENTLCSHEGVEVMKEKLGGKKEDACAYVGCIYYKFAKAATQQGQKV